VVGAAGINFLAIERLLYETAAFGNVLVDDELLVIRSGEENHYCSGSSMARRERNGDRRVLKRDWAEIHPI